MTTTLRRAPARLVNFPISYFAVVMGLAGAAIAWEQAHAVFELPQVVADALLIATIVSFVVIAAFYGAKIVRARDAVVAELRDPIRLAFFPTISISVLLLSVATMHHSMGVSEVLWVVGSIAHLAFTLSVMRVWIHEPRFELGHLNPAWFIPVVGNILVPVAGTAHGHDEVSWFFFSIGLLFWLVLLTIVFNRIVFHAPMPMKLVPTMFILIAPPAVGFVSYVRLTGGIDPFARILYYAALFLALLLLTQIDRFWHLDFFLSWWAYSFPLAAMAIATMVMYEQNGEQFFELAAYALLAIASVVVLVLLFRTTHAIARKEICIEEA